MLTKVQTVIKLAHCTLFVLQIVHRCDSGPRTVRLAHQITMAGDKVLSGDCRFARRNYFPDARKEIVACVTMARSLRRRYLAMETRNEFLHGTFLPPSSLPPSFSLRLLLARPFCRHASSPFLPRRSDSSLSCRFEARQSWSPPLRESWRASFNEKLISRVKSSTASGEQDLFFFFFLLVPGIARRPGLCCVFIQRPFPSSPLV